MALIIALLWSRQAWRENISRNVGAGVPPLVKAAFSLLAALSNFCVFITLTAIVHEWLHATLRASLLSSSLRAADTVGLLVALTAMWTGLHKAWHHMHSTTPGTGGKSPLAMGVCALAALFSAPSFPSWMPQVRVHGQPVWQMLVAAPAQPTAETPHAPRPTQLQSPEDRAVPAQPSFDHALSVHANKSVTAVRRILALTRSPDTTYIAGRCLWGLNDTGPDKDVQTDVASQVVALLGVRSGDYLWQRGLTLIAKYAGPNERDKIEALAARQTLPPERKAALNKIAVHIQADQ